MNKLLPTVAIIGRPNVGKSSLFNRLIEKRVSIMHDSPGVTRDRIYHTCEWLSREFNLIDTGGFTKERGLTFQTEINSQVEIAMLEADLVIFLVSTVDGITREDEVVANLLRRSKKPFILAANKSDNLELSLAANNLYSLGMGEAIPVSSIHSIGISELLDAIIAKIPKSKSDIDDSLRIGIVGKPNVGKSTFVNTILNDNRNIVSDIPGTTRDSIETKFIYKDKSITFTDTAGLKRNKKALDDIEWYAELRTQLSILNSDVILLLVDPSQKLTQIDERIMGILKDEYKPVIVIINKMDIASVEERKEMEDHIRSKFKFASWVPIMFTSALKNKNVTKALDKALDIEDKRKIQISKSSLNDFLIDIQMIKKPPRHNGINVKLNYITYSNTTFPHFIIFTKNPDYVHFSYVRFIENQIRNVFDLEGIPIKITLRGKA